jgi:hypothetical protein
MCYYNTEMFRTLLGRGLGLGLGLGLVGLGLGLGLGLVGSGLGLGLGLVAKVSFNITGDSCTSTKAALGIGLQATNVPIWNTDEFIKRKNPSSTIGKLERNETNY